MTARRARLERIATAAGVLAPTALLATLFPADLLLAPTTAAGGDLGSHNYAAAAARHLLFTEGRLTGWVPGNFCGFPLFQMYFPLPFVIMAAGSLALAPAVAFKLTSILGVLALPAAAWGCLAARRAPFPAPALAPSLVLLFLLQAGNSAWGGNLQSTMAGEFAFSISLVVALAHLGLHHRALASARWAAVSAILVALLALSHAYSALWVALTWAIALAARRDVVGASARTATVFAWGGALSAFWLIPLLWHTPWTTAFHHLWVIGSLAEVFPATLWPAVAGALVPPLLLWWRSHPSWAAYRTASGVIWAGAAAGALAYLAAPSFGIVDVRFLPFLQLALCLLAAMGLGSLVSRWPAPALSVLIAFFGAALLTDAEARRIGSWIRWNYEGFERKPQWPVYAALAEHLRGDEADPRVAYEHSPDHEALGTIRAFENLPLFAGRSTLEGVNMQASVTAPFVFYVQSEISEVMSCPFGEWGCSRTDLESGVEHLAMMNVSDLIVRSTAVKAAAARHRRLIRTATFGPYETFRLDGYPSGYVVALNTPPYVVATPDWKTDAYRWFKRARFRDRIPVFVRPEDNVTPAAFSGRFDGVPDPLPAAGPQEGSTSLVEQVTAERIVVRGHRPGQPLLVRVSFHPGWQSTTGERVWLAGPGFMLVVPRGSELELVYESRTPAAAGRVLTFVALGGIALVLIGTRRGHGADTVTRRADTPSKVRRLAIGTGVAAAMLGAGAGTRARLLHADTVYLQGIEQMDAGRTEESRALFQLARARAPLSNTAVHSTYFEAIALYRARRWNDALQTFALLVERFPEAQAAAEATYHVGLCAEELDDTTRAVRAYEDTRQRFPETAWAKMAAARLDILAPP